MGSKWRITPWLLAAVMLALALGCVAEDEVKKGKLVLTWDMLARAIDRQLGMINDGTPQSCGGQGDNLRLGEHCKDQLQGRVSRSTVVQYMQLTQDTVLVDGDTAFYYQGFMPRTTSPCIEDGDSNGTEDFLDACDGGLGITCSEVNGRVELVYDNCIWYDPQGDDWTLNGRKDLYFYMTSAGEEVFIIHGTGASGYNNSTDESYSFSGYAIRYFWLDPFTGGPALGTTGRGIDGMEIVDVTVTVDMNGPSNTYNLNYAYDYEDGDFFYSMPGPGVWLSNPGDSLLRFYLAGSGWDNSALGGCVVEILSVDPLTRTFTFTSQGTYPNAGCIPDVNPPGPVSY